jgi:endonuclease/exonuclease/phosphatase family metal-dependent hydrolase
VRVLQMNLCNSGIAGCYTGRSVAQAAAVIRAESPDLVTLNEVCADDVAVLERALADAVPGGHVVSAFAAAGDRRTGGDWRCVTGGAFGNGVVARLRPAAPRYTSTSGLYPVQDTADPEERVWLCLTPTGRTGMAVCTTHLADTSRAVAQAQCAHLWGTVVPQVRARDGGAPLVLGADFNLGPAGSPAVRSCLPGGNGLADDGGVQTVAVTPELLVGAHRTIGMRGTTDHPGLLVTLGPRDELARGTR